MQISVEICTVGITDGKSYYVLTPWSRVLLEKLTSFRS
jgi:hypothetical protein